MDSFFPNWAKQRPHRNQARPVASDSDGPKHWSDKFLEGPLSWLLILVLAVPAFFFFVWLVETVVGGLPNDYYDPVPPRAD